MSKMFRRATSGQVTILVLLLGILGLTIGLSTASRSLSDLKQASYVDVGTKALAAAESGMEVALNNLANNTSTATCPPGTVGTGPIIPGITTINYTICGADKNSVVAEVGKDDVFDVDLSQSQPKAQEYYVYWNGTSTPIEITVLMIKSGTSYAVDRFAANASGDSGGGNLFNTPSLKGINCNIPDNSYDNCVRLYPSPPGGPRDSAGNSDILIRVRPHGTTLVKVLGNKPGNSVVLYGAYYTLTAWATTANNTVRKIQVTKTPYLGLPAGFDSGIFSGRDLTK